MNTRLKAGGYWVNTEITEEGNRLFFKFGFNRPLMAEIKAMEGARFHGFDPVNPRKLWSIPITAHNDFQLRFLKGENVYATWDAPLIDLGVPETRYNHSKREHLRICRHQRVMASHIYQRHYCIIAGEMGTGKSLSYILAMEKAALEFKEKYGSDMVCWMVAPKAGLKALERELIIWGSKIRPLLLTYEELVKQMKAWENGKQAPHFVIFDESSRLKNHTSQRSQAARALADGVRKDHGPIGFVVLGSGSPAPKSPADWWSQAEIAWPGFLKEGDIYKFRERLAFTVKQKSAIDAGSYTKLIGWKDDERKCAQCGQLADHENHLELMGGSHAWIASKNEIKTLYKRLQGLTVIYFKKDCLDLPEKHYRTIELKPTPSLLRAAKLIQQTASTTIEGLTLLRELSDGFQYIDTPDGETGCHVCRGEKQFEQNIEVEGSCPNCKDGHLNEAGFPQCLNHTPIYRQEIQPCPHCGGKGIVPRFVRSTKEIPGPKDDAVVDILDEMDEVGRAVIYAGFTASIDRVTKICQRKGWHVLRVDSRGWILFDNLGNKIPATDFNNDYLSVFQDFFEQYPRVAFVAHPGSAGMSVTLTASPIILYYSNDFNGENRIQSEDRIHRPGMDLNRGATIIDLVHLPSDRKILENLKKKRDLQAMSLGDFKFDEDAPREH